MSKRKIASYKVPLLNGGHTQKKVAAAAGAQAIAKPGTKLGGVYIDDMAGKNMGVALCDDCVTKYYGFWNQTGHRGNFGYYFTAHCDGCGTRYSLCTLFLPEANFNKVLAPNHGKVASPKRRIFKFPWRS